MPFSDVRLPPPSDEKKDIGEGDEVEVSMSPNLQTDQCLSELDFPRFSRSSPDPMTRNLTDGGWERSA